MENLLCFDKSQSFIAKPTIPCNLNSSCLFTAMLIYLVNLSYTLYLWHKCAVICLFVEDFSIIVQELAYALPWQLVGIYRVYSNVNLSSQLRGFLCDQLPTAYLNQLAFALGSTCLSFAAARLSWSSSFFLSSLPAFGLPRLRIQFKVRF